MTETSTQLRGNGTSSQTPLGPGARAESGAATFADLAWAHYEWEKLRYDPDGHSGDAEEAYFKKLNVFEHRHGDVVHAYWSTRAASAVAMTERVRRRRFDPLRLREVEAEIRLHRVTDWLLHEAELADLLQQCDVMAVKAGAVLRGGNERTVMRWILGVMEHVVGFIERTQGQPTDDDRKALLASQKEELAKVEDFYLRAGGQAGRIVYFTGMLLGAVVVVAVGVLAALVLWPFGLLSGETGDELGMLFLCCAAGALGSLVSVMSRLRPGGKFTLDFEVGRPLVRRLGLYRPAVGAVFGVLLYAVLQSGLLLVDPTDAQFPGDPVYYFAVAAFVAGFSERWVHVVIGGVQKTITP
jgi:hypothetical protein